jgi:hypothetical protein
MRKVFCLFIVFCILFTAAAPAYTVKKKRTGLGPGGLLIDNYSCILQWYKGAWGKTKYRRQIVDIRINAKSAMVVFSNNSQRNLYSIAIINNVYNNEGTLKAWRVARNNQLDTLLLRNGKFIHGIITGYNNDKYTFKLRKAVHRDDIHIVYPNPTIPLHKRK